MDGRHCARFTAHVYVIITKKSPFYLLMNEKSQIKTLKERKERERKKKRERKEGRNEGRKDGRENVILYCGVALLCHQHSGG
jgi:hypothetical protein